MLSRGVTCNGLPIPLVRFLGIRDFVTLPTKVRIVKAMAFPVVMYGCES